MTGTSGYNVALPCPWCDRKVYGFSENSIARARATAEERRKAHVRSCKAKSNKAARGG